MKLVLVKMNQTEAEKDALEAAWNQIETLGYVTVTSREEPDLTWTTAITTVSSMIDQIRLLSVKENGSWDTLIRVRDTVEDKEKEIDSNDYTTIRFVV